MPDIIHIAGLVDCGKCRCRKRPAVIEVGRYKLCAQCALHLVAGITSMMGIMCNRDEDAPTRPFQVRSK